VQKNPSQNFNMHETEKETKILKKGKNHILSNFQLSSISICQEKN